MANVQIGDIKPAAYATAGANWLLADGTAISRTTYADLFSVIGTTFGIGDGSTTFNLPDMQGRIPLGAGSGSGLTTRTLGQSGGQEAITDVPEHNHSMSVNNSAGSFSTPSGNYLGVEGSAIGLYESTDDGSTLASGAINNTGNASVDVMNPYLVVQYVICYQVDQPTGNYRYLEELTASTTLSDGDIMYATLSPTTTPLSRKITWANIKSLLSAIFFGKSELNTAIDVGTNATTWNFNSQTNAVLEGVYTAGSYDITQSNTTNLKYIEIWLDITGTVTIGNLTGFFFPADSLPSGVTWAVSPDNDLEISTDGHYQILGSYNEQLSEYICNIQFIKA